MGIDFSRYYGWTFANFHDRLFFKMEARYNILQAYNSFPVSIEIHKFFKENFTSACSFREMKEMLLKRGCNDLHFDGRSRKSFNFGTITLDEHDFKLIFEFIDEKKDLHAAFEGVLNELLRLRNENKRLRSKSVRSESEDVITSLRTIAKFFKNEKPETISI